MRTGSKGFAIITGTTLYNVAGAYTYPVPRNFRSLAVTKVDGTGGTNVPCANPCSPPSFFGSPGTPSSFNAAGNATYNRSATGGLKPRQAIAVVVGAGGAGGACPCGGPSGVPGSPGTVQIVVS